MLPTILIIAWLTLPALVWFALICVRRRFHPVLICALCFVTMIAGTVVLANYVYALDAQLLAEIDKYESGTPEAQRASEEWASDTDRSFLFLFSPVLSAIWYGVVFVSLFCLQRVVSQISPAKNPTENSSMAIETAKERVDDGNPYQPPNVG